MGYEIVWLAFPKCIRSGRGGGGLREKENYLIKKRTCAWGGISCASFTCCFHCSEIV